MLLYDSSGLNSDIHALFHSKFKHGTWENSEILLCGQKKLKKTPGENFKYLVCNMTNTMHHVIPEHCKMISLEGQDLCDVRSTAEHTIFLMMSMIKRRSRDEEFGLTLANKSLGIIGYGRVGRQLENLGKAFGMTVFIVNEPGYYSDYLYIRQKQAAFNCDFICLTASVKGNKKPILGPDELVSIKDGAYIVNTSRGCLIDNKAMLNNIDRFGGFASDFRLPFLLETKQKVVTTEHTGGYTICDLRRTSELCYKLLMEEINGIKNEEQ